MNTENFDLVNIRRYLMQIHPAEILLFPAAFPPIKDHLNEFKFQSNKRYEEHIIHKGQGQNKWEV